MPTLTIPPTWRRGLMRSPVTSLHLMYCEHIRSTDRLGSMAATMIEDPSTLNLPQSRIPREKEEDSTQSQHVKTYLYIKTVF